MSELDLREAVRRQNHFTKWFREEGRFFRPLKPYDVFLAGYCAGEADEKERKKKPHKRKGVR